MCVVSPVALWLDDSGCLERGAPRGLGLCKLAESPALNHPRLISRHQSYCNQCSLLALCGINVTEINFTVFSLDPHNGNLFLQSKFMSPRIQFPSHPPKLGVQRLIGIYLVITVIHPSMNNAILNLQCLILVI